MGMASLRKPSGGRQNLFQVGPCWREGFRRVVPTLKWILLEACSPELDGRKRLLKSKMEGDSQSLKQLGTRSAASAQVGRRPLPSTTTPGIVRDACCFAMAKAGPCGAGGSEGNGPEPASARQWDVIL